MDLSELRANVYRRLAETSGANFTDAEVKTALNEEYDFIISHLATVNEEYFAKQLLTKTTGSSPYAFPEDFLKLISIEYLTDGSILWTPVPYVELDRREYMINWRSWFRGEAVVHYYIIGDNFYLVPEPVASGTDNLRMVYGYMPPLLDTDDDTPAFPRVYHEAIEIGATNRLRTSLREPPIDEGQYARITSSLFTTAAPRVKANPKAVRLDPGGLY